MQIGSHHLKNKLILAPMAGITDRPFRNLCRDYGAGLAISEMVSSNPALRKNKRTLLKADHSGENGLRSVQILGTDPLQMAEAARFNEQRGADIIDINMGCPAKKVCAVAAGSALLKNETLVAQILDAVVNAVEIPVTLKIRTGWDLSNRNALTIAKLAENSGIAALSIHGRTRACKFNGEAEYETIKKVKQHVNIPIIANGDIDSPEKASFVLNYTKADAIMIGRGAQGQPWIFKQLQQYLAGENYSRPSANSIHNTIMLHLDHLYSFYGDNCGVRMARKHIGWYFKNLGIANEQTRKLYETTSPKQQTALLTISLDSFLNDNPA
ncbi:MAG: tRNA dihydrouridine synthase DusB [Methylococcaceae bacterium]|nr:tRNA dihydrouridine synthase DusB [Methylococcaceae bacterium]